jgi:hypothetical protein
MIRVYRSGAMNAAIQASRRPDDPKASAYNRQMVEKYIDDYLSFFMDRLSAEGLDGELDETADMLTIDVMCSSQQETEDLHAVGIPTFWEWWQ